MHRVQRYWQADTMGPLHSSGQVFEQNRERVLSTSQCIERCSDLKASHSQVAASESLSNSEVGQGVEQFPQCNLGGEESKHPVDVAVPRCAFICVAQLEHASVTRWGLCQSCKMVSLVLGQTWLDKSKNQFQHGLKKKPVDNPCILMPQYRSVSVFFLCIGLQCFGSSGSKVATFPYKCSMRSTLCQLPAPAGNRNFQYKCSTQSTFWQLQLESSNFSVVCAGHFGSSGSKVAAFQCKQV